jgi:hypothetical protein
MKGKLIRPAFVVLAIVGIALVAGGIAYATVPDGSGVIHGCYQKNQGTLRVIDTGTTQTCSSSEAPLTWSQTGPQGQPGQQGEPGPTGPSDVWSVDGCCANGQGLPFQTPENLATTSTLPAGSYFVQAETEAENTAFSVSNDYFCDLVDSSNQVYQDTRVTSSDWVTIPVQAVITLTSPDTISLQCEDANQAGAEAFNWQLAAIKIGTVHS